MLCFSNFRSPIRLKTSHQPKVARWTSSSSHEVHHRPTDIKLKKKEKALFVTFEDGKTIRYPAEFLRVESPSAEVTGHGAPEHKKLVAGRMHVGIANIDAVGNYAIRIVFDDLHETGIYTWDYLHKIGTNKMELMRNYIKKLQAAGNREIQRKILRREDLHRHE
eukprot:TRINITY_DN17238_c0_g1_i1.p1 TRINITY_DN17238_c0_g1~~TRINITY_DN17238_c0_g1_i1.p1  ORF type:complete len:164 (+),score=19.24 TRINITY_DN17238_c0_g1_i1:233-724(+)